MSINDDAMADLFKLPEPDYIHVSKLDDPIGSGRSWKFPAMRKMLHRAEAAEKQRDELLAASVLFIAAFDAPYDTESQLQDALEAAANEIRAAIASAKGA